MSIGFSEEELLGGYAAWLRWLKQKRSELASKQAKLERRMGSNNSAEKMEHPVEPVLTESSSPDVTHTPTENTVVAAPAGDEEVALDDWL